MKTEPNWNELIEEYDNHDHAISDWRLGYQVVEQLLGEIKGKNILDYGCGTGKFARRLDNLGASVTGVDISAKAIDKAKNRYSRNINYQFISNSDISHLKSKTFDMAMANFVLCCIEEDREIKKILDQIYQKLKDKGKLIILEPHPLSLGQDYISMAREKPSNLQEGSSIRVQLSGLGKTFHDYWRPQSAYSTLFQKAGFKIIEIQEPTVKENTQEKFWKDEKKQAPFIIFALQKE